MDFYPDYELIKQGAESKIYAGEFLGRAAVLKERFEKKYRHPVLDVNITKDRIKAETRAIMRCKAAGISTPVMYLVDLNRRLILMEHIQGITVKEYIKKLEAELQQAQGNGIDAIHSKLQELGSAIGQMVGCLHASNIIHGDLTSSNILLRDNQSPGICIAEEGETSLTQSVAPEAEWQRLVLIDFGLSKMDPSVEDKGVDLYVLERALTSTHPVVGESVIFPAFLKAYINKGKKGSNDVLAKFEEVRMRGRKRTMVG